MNIKYKNQDFQQKAVNAVCDVFEGQKNDSYRYVFRNENKGIRSYSSESRIFAWKNRTLDLKPEQLLEKIQSIQKKNDIPQSSKLEGNGLNLTIEMETGTGKTFVYVNTIYELNKRYGMTKFIIVVPSIAIREGVSQSFKDMEYYFSVKYGKRIRYFIFNSQKSDKIESFATNSGINVMIINSHAFNKKETNNMYKKTERGSKLIDYISQTNPIIIIDEPQSIEGKSTKLALKDFNALFTVRYSATNREKYNMIYIFDAADAFKHKKVKQISVKGIDIKGTTATNSYLYLEGIDTSKTKYPQARIEIDIKQKNEIVKKVKIIKEGDDLYSPNFSKGLEEYKGYKVSEITSKFVKFTNGQILYTGQVKGNVTEDQKRIIQIRETIRAHIRKEIDLYPKKIKVLSLFFIDKVENYRKYDEKTNDPIAGKYSEMFEEEYNKVLSEFDIDNPIVKEYYESISANETHEGYFSIDKKGKLVNPKESGRGKQKVCNDASAYDLIMKNKKLLLSFKSKVRFIFSHSALREGWDNPNVFQICVLRNTDPSKIRTRQEVGRGLRLCVNQNLERIDSEFEGIDADNVNLLTVIANDSYEKYAGKLQKEFSEYIRERPSKLTIEFLTNKKINNFKITEDIAKSIHYDFTVNGYIDKNYNLTDKYHNDLKENCLKISDELKPHISDIITIVKELYSNEIKINNENDFGRVPNKINTKNFNSKEFKKLWSYINKKSMYKVEFDTNELIDASIKDINTNLVVNKIKSFIKTGILKDNFNVKDLTSGNAFKESEQNIETIYEASSSNYKVDLIGKIVSETKLTRKTIISILSKMNKNKFDLFKYSPEDFIIKISRLINKVKAILINDNIVYFKSNKTIPINIFEKSILSRGKSESLNKYIYDYLIYDSKVERDFAKDLDITKKVSVFSKLPKGEYIINTPVGNYSPDWMIVFDKNDLKYAYFVVETKGDPSNLQLKEIENIKIKCAKKHFKAISQGKIKFEVVDDFKGLTDKLIYLEQ